MARQLTEREIQEYERQGYDRDAVIQAWNAYNSRGYDPLSSPISPGDPRAMQLGSTGADFIKSHEALRLNAYDDGFGNWTIGWGHTGGVQPGDQITEEQAQALFDADVAEVQQAIAQTVTAPLSQGQYDALVSFGFNVGAAPISKIAENINVGDYVGAAARMGLYSKAKVNGVLTDVPGLATRRAEENAMFNGVPTQQDSVRVAQQQLAAAGYDPGPIDGVYGSRTQQAVMDYQATNGLPVDGVISDAMIGQLANLAETTPQQQLETGWESLLTALDAPANAPPMSAIPPSGMPTLGPLGPQQPIDPATVMAEAAPSPTGASQVYTQHGDYQEITPQLSATAPIDFQTALASATPGIIPASFGSLGDPAALVGNAYAAPGMPPASEGSLPIGPIAASATGPTGAPIASEGTLPDLGPLFAPSAPAPGSPMPLVGGSIPSGGIPPEAVGSLGAPTASIDPATAEAMAAQASVAASEAPPMGLAPPIGSASGSAMAPLPPTSMGMPSAPPMSLSGTAQPMGGMTPPEAMGSLPAPMAAGPVGPNVPVGATQGGFDAAVQAWADQQNAAPAPIAPMGMGSMVSMAGSPEANTSLQSAAPPAMATANLAAGGMSAAPTALPSLGPPTSVTNTQPVYTPPPPPAAPPAPAPMPAPMAPAPAPAPTPAKGLKSPLGVGDVVKTVIGGIVGGPIGALVGALGPRVVGSVQNAVTQPVMSRGWESYYDSGMHGSAPMGMSGGNTGGGSWGSGGAFGGGWGGSGGWSGSAGGWGGGPAYGGGDPSYGGNRK